MSGNENKIKEIDRNVIVLLFYRVVGTLYY